MMKGWPVAQIETQKRRWAVLKHLHDTPGYELNRHILMLGAKAQGIPTTRDQMDHALDWLADNELITLQTLGDQRLARLTSDGQEVALGDRVMAGVLRPGPGI